jgi:hypothetical protein
VYFGYPQAHEDDPQRAVRTGLGILAAMENLNARLQQANRSCRKITFPNLRCCCRILC